MRGITNEMTSWIIVKEILLTSDNRAQRMIGGIDELTSWMVVKEILTTDTDNGNKGW